MCVSVCKSLVRLNVWFCIVAQSLGTIVTNGLRRAVALQLLEREDDGRPLADLLRELLWTADAVHILERQSRLVRGALQPGLRWWRKLVLITMLDILNPRNAEM